MTSIYTKTIEDYRVKEGAGRRRAALAYALLNRLLSQHIGKPMVTETVWLATDLLRAVRDGAHDARWYGMARMNLAISEAVSDIKEAADAEHYRLASAEAEAVHRWGAEADTLEGFVAKARDVYEAAIKETSHDPA